MSEHDHVVVVSPSEPASVVVLPQSSPGVPFVAGGAQGVPGPPGRRGIYVQTTAPDPAELQVGDIWLKPAT